MSTHSLLSPSKLARIVRCPGSLAASKGLADEPSQDAASGTLTHWISATVLINGVDPAYFIGKTLFVHHNGNVEQTANGPAFRFEVDEERIERVLFYTNAIKREPAPYKLIEVRLDTSNVLGVEGQSGTGDAVLLDPEREEIGVHDLKDGIHPVHAKHNEQLLTYGASAMDQYAALGNWKRLRVAIHQPRQKVYDEWTYERAEVDARMNDIATAARDAYALYCRAETWYDPERRKEIQDQMVPGSVQCKWCPLRGQCPAQKAAVLAQFSASAQVDTTAFLPDLALSDDQLADAMNRVALIEDWCRHTRGEAFKRALRGGNVPGYKLVRGKKGNRYWKEPTKAADSLALLLGEDKAYVRELISPTAAEKALRGQYTVVKDFVDQSEGALTLVSADDPRPVEAAPPKPQFGIMTYEQEQA